MRPPRDPDDFRLWPRWDSLYPWAQFYLKWGWVPWAFYTLRPSIFDTIRDGYLWEAALLMPVVIVCFWLAPFWQIWAILHATKRFIRNIKFQWKNLPK